MSTRTTTTRLVSIATTPRTSMATTTPTKMT